MSPLDDKLAELRARFVQRSAEEVAAIDRATAEEDREALIERAHAIAGIAGLFGFGELGTAAADLEELGRAGGDIKEAGARLRAMLAALAAH